VTVFGAHVPPVRRTVRIAMLLVAGQLLLGAVIGWVTLNPPHRGGLAAGRAAEPAAGPTVTAAPPGPAAPPPAPASSRPPKPLLLLRVRATVPPTTPAPAAPAVATSPGAPRTLPPASRPSSAPATTPLPPAPPTSSGSPDPGLHPTPSGSGDVQEPVTVGAPCAPPGAPGRSADGTVLRCVPAPDGTPRWEIA
jgi:hypothetical protein